MAFMTKWTNDLSWVSTKTVFLYWCGCCWELVCFYIFDGWWKLKSLLAAQAWKDHQVLLLWAQEPSAASIKKMQKNKKALQTIDTAKLSSTFIYFHSFPFLRKRWQEMSFLSTCLSIVTGENPLISESIFAGEFFYFNWNFQSWNCWLCLSAVHSFSKCLLSLLRWWWKQWAVY